MRKAMDYLPRRAVDRVLEALTDTRVVVVNGARQVGKSTLAEVVLRQTGGGVRGVTPGVHHMTESIDRGESPYLQIARHYREKIERGELQPG